MAYRTWREVFFFRQAWSSAIDRNPVLRPSPIRAHIHELFTQYQDMSSSNLLLLQKLFLGLRPEGASITARLSCSFRFLIRKQMEL